MRAIEARRADIGPLPGWPAMELAIERVGAVFQHQQIVLVSDRPQRIPIRDVAHQIGDDHCPGFGRDHFLDLFDHDVERVRIDIDERRDQAVLDLRCDGGREGQRRGDDFGIHRQFHRRDAQQQGRGSGVYHHAARLAEQARDLFLERLDVGPGKRRCPHHIGDGLDFFLVADTECVWHAQILSTLIVRHVPCLCRNIHTIAPACAAMPCFSARWRIKRERPSSRPIFGDQSGNSVRARVKSGQRRSGLSTR